MAKRLSIHIKREILNLFIDGRFSIDELSNKFECTKQTIIRNLKKELGNEHYQEIIYLGKSKNKSKPSKEDMQFEGNQNKSTSVNVEDVEFDFVELTPLDYEIENAPRKEISSISIEDVKFPNIVYMVVNKNIELEIKLLGDYPDWEFLPSEDLKRKTLEIYFDLKSAKRACTREQKVIKVPNTDVFRIASPILVSRGITRIVSTENLIAL